MKRGTKAGETPTGTGCGRETVLVAVGRAGGDRLGALADAAAEVAGPMHATVRVLHVFEPDRFQRAVAELEYDGDRRPAPDALARRVAPVRTVVRDLAGPLRDHGVPLRVAGRIGDDVAGEIVAEAEAVDATRVVVGGRRRTPTGKAVFGSTAQHVLIDAAAPVTFVRDP
ncbi:MAG: universal stress protein [Halolamina sp.]